MGKVGYGDIGKHEVLEGENNHHHGHGQLQQQNMAREDVGSRDSDDVSVPGVRVVVEDVEQDVDSSLVDKMKGKISQRLERKEEHAQNGLQSFFPLWIIYIKLVFW